MDAERSDITVLLQDALEGEETATEKLVEAVYRELERVAERQMAQRYGAHLAGVTLEPAALVNDTLLKLLQAPREFDNRRHFYSFATRVMMRVLLDYQRARSAKKRGGDAIRVTLTPVADASTTYSVEQFPPILDELEALDERKAEVVKLRVFWGLAMSEIAELLGLSVPTIERDWRFARRWLAAKLRPEEGS